MKRRIAQILSLGVVLFLGSQSLISCSTSDETAKYLIEFRNYDNSLLYSVSVEEGTIPTYEGDAPTRSSTDKYEYTFSGWDKEITAATQDTTYTAQFSEALIDQSSDFTYSVIETEGDFYGKYLIASYKGDKESPNLPSSYDGVEVIGIDIQAFYSNTNIKEITLPSNYLIIGPQAFAGSTSLTTVNLPDALQVLDAQAFANCTNLQTINLPKSLTTISSEVFSGDTALDVDLSNMPSSLTSIGKNAFYNCSAITSELVLPEGITSVGDYAFDNTSITKVTIPSTLSSLSADAFFNATEITQYIVAEDNPKFSSYEGVLYDKKLTTLYLIPAKYYQSTCTIPEGVKTISGYCATFAEIDTLYLPSTLTSIEYDAFYTNNIKNFVFDEATNGAKLSLSGEAFGKSLLLESITLPDGLTKIPADCFKGSPNLSEVIIPSSVTTIGDNAFYGTAISTFTFPSALKRITTGMLSGTNVSTLTIPSNITAIEESAFANNSNLTSVTFEDGINLTSVGGLLFQFDKNLTAVTNFPISSKVVEFPYGAFRGSGIISFEIPNSYQVIDNYAFMDTANFATLTIHTSITSVAKWAFENSALKDIYYDGTKDEFLAITVATGTYENDTPEEKSSDYIWNHATVHLSDGTTFIPAELA